MRCAWARSRGVGPAEPRRRRRSVARSIRWARSRPATTRPPSATGRGGNRSSRRPHWRLLDRYRAGAATVRRAADPRPRDGGRAPRHRSRPSAGRAARSSGSMRRAACWAWRPPQADARSRPRERDRLELVAGRRRTAAVPGRVVRPRRVVVRAPARRRSRRRPARGAAGPPAGGSARDRHLAGRPTTSRSSRTRPSRTRSMRSTIDDEGEAEEARSGDFASADAAAAQFRRAGFRDVRADERSLVHRHDPATYVDFLEQYAESELFEDLEPDLRRRLRERDRQPARPAAGGRVRLAGAGRRGDRAPPLTSSGTLVALRNYILNGASDARRHRRHPHPPAVSNAVSTPRPDGRSVARVVTARSQLEGEGFVVRRPFPSVELSFADPFVLLDHLGAVEYAPGEAKGAPWHPHRGFETVTYIIDGAVEHQDSTGGGGLITDGATQWMTAGAGILHSEMPPEQLVVHGRPLPRRPALGQPASRAASGRRRATRTSSARRRAAVEPGRRRARPGDRRRARRPRRTRRDPDADHLPARDGQPGRRAHARLAARVQRPRLRAGRTRLGRRRSERPLDEGQLAILGAGRRRSPSARPTRQPSRRDGRLGDPRSSAACRSASRSPATARS